MMDHANAEIDLIAGIDIVLQVVLQIEVPDIRRDIDIVVIRIDPDLIAVVAVNKGSIRKKPAVDDVIPPRRTRSIPIVDAKGLTKCQIVPPEITGQIEPVLRSQTVVTLD